MQVPKLNPSSPFPSLSCVFSNSDSQKRKTPSVTSSVVSYLQGVGLVSPWIVQVDSQVTSWVQQGSPQSQQPSIEHLA